MGFLRTTLVSMPSVTASAGSFALAGQSADLKVGAGTSTGFNGGRSQTNFGFLYPNQGDHPFLNTMKISAAVVLGDGSAATPDMFNSDGYPLATGTHGVYRWQPVIPAQTERPGNYIVTWDGTGTTSIGAGGSQLGTVTFTGSITGTTLTISGLSGTIQPGQCVVGGTVLPYTFIMSGSGTTWTVSKSQTATGITGANGGSSTSSGGAGAGFFACTVLPTVTYLNVSISAVGSPIITNIQAYHVDDAARVAAGETFGTEFLRRLREANFGVLRFLNWQNGNDTNMATWNTRKPINYVSYNGDSLNNSFYAGTSSQTSNAYVTSQFPAVHSSDGTAWTSGGPKDKDTIHVCFTNSATQSGTCSLSIGTSGIAKNVLNRFGGPLSEAYYFYPIGGTASSLSTLVYDVDLSAWIMHGGNSLGTVGLANGAPYEISMQLCKEVGAHPWFISPHLALDPATSFVAELAQYCKTYAAANATWMIPRIEGPNEQWNGNFPASGYANRKSIAHWGSGTYQDAYGKWMANIGQMCAGVYGLGNLGVTYQAVCGIRTTDTPSESNERLASTLYIAGAGPDPAITGSFGTISFTKQAAKLTTSTVCCTQYNSPVDRFTVNELIYGYNYTVTNKSNSSAQATLANTYCDGLLGASTAFNLAYLNGCYTAIKSWAAGYGVNKMCGYEGSWSPDYLASTLVAGGGGAEADAWLSSVTGRTQANPAILQLTSSCNNFEHPGFVGNPGVVGMSVVVCNTGTQFDNPGMYTRPVTFTAASPTISGTNTLVVNQAVFFRTDTGTLPTGTGFGTPTLALTLSPSQTYSETFYVIATGLTGSTFQVSASRGGPAITFSTVGSGGAGTSGTATGVYVQEGWFITNVDSANNRITLDCNSTGFTAPAGGNVSYSKSLIYSNNLRQAGKLSPNLYGHTLTNFNNFVAAGGEYPSNYLMAGNGPLSGNVWNNLEPLTQSPNPPQWLAFIAFNH